MIRQLKIGRSITDRGSASLQKYLNDISRMPLITAEEEEDLARRIHQGDHKAEELLVEANLRFVVSVAKQYQNSSMDLEDLVSEGNIGLIRAAQKFDETKGFKFISYAVWWIRQSILSALSEKGLMIRIPLNQASVISKVNKAIHEFVQKEGRNPSLSELSDTLDIDDDLVKRALESKGQHMSFDAPIQDGENDRTFLDTMPIDAPASDDHLIRESLNEELDRIMQQVLTDKERSILTMSFGIGTEPRSLDEIGLVFSLSRERVRQIRERSIKKLHDTPSNSMLRAYL